MARYFPTTMRYFLQREATITREVMGVEESEVVRPAFPTDNERDNTHETARLWGQRSYRHATWQQNGQNPYTVEEVVVDNLPISGLRVWEIAIRGNGGRAWKVIDSRGYLFDLREEPLLYAMVKHGIDPGGLLGGQWVWMRNGSQMNLVCVGSPDYDDALVEMQIATKSEENKKPLRSKDLVRGGVYQTSRDQSWSRRIYLGRGRLDGKLQYMWYELRDPDKDPQEALALWLQGKDKNKVWNRDTHDFVEVIEDSRPAIYLTQGVGVKYHAGTCDFPEHLPDHNYNFLTTWGLPRDAVVTFE